MKIAFLVVKNLLRGGGIEKYTLELGSHLVKRGHEVTVYSTRHYGQVPDSHLGMRIIGVPSLPIRCMEKLSCSAVAAIESSLGRAFDIVHFHSIGAGSFAWICRLRGQRCVLQMHGVEWRRGCWGNFGSQVLKFLEKSALPQVHGWTAVSKTQCDYFLKHHGIKMEYIPTATNIKPKAKAREILQFDLKPKNYILFASRLVKEKGAHYLIPAFKRLNADMKLVIAGDVKGQGNYKKDILGLVGSDPRILLPGFVEGRLLEELFSHAYVYVQPSEVEGLSVSLLEAMSYGNCCLVSNIPENLEAIGNAGFHFKSKNIDSLEQRLDWLLRHRRYAEAVGMRAKERVRVHYSWDFVTNQMENLYLSVLRAK